MAQGALRPERANALCALLPDRTVRDWAGTVETLSSTNDGRGVLVVRISPNITLGTTNNALSEDLSTEKTLIPIGSPLFAQVASMHTGQRVVFSGRLSRGEDCFRETSLTVTGDMTAPEFEMQFTATRPMLDDPAHAYSKRVTDPSCQPEECGKEVFAGSSCYMGDCFDQFIVQIFKLKNGITQVNVKIRPV
jgi:hypothetical protein